MKALVASCWLFVVSCSVLAFTHGVEDKDMSEKVLAYHSIGDSVNEVGAGLYCVPEQAFREQMEWVADHNKVTVTFGDSHLINLIITFDDGDITNYSKAYPILKELGLKAHFFIIGEWVGKPGYMGWKEIKELKDGGMVIGSHGMTHKILTELSAANLDYELEGSKTLLEVKLNTKVDSISIPRGIYNNRVIDKAKAAGYKAIFTSSVKDRDGIKHGRIVVRSDWDMKRFIDAIHKGPSLADNMREFIKNSLRKLLGDGGYDRVRSSVLKTVDRRP